MSQCERCASLEAELAEEARMNGMGSEREARLIARIEELEREVETLQARLNVRMKSAHIW